MTTIPELQDLLYDWIVAAVGRPTVYANGGLPLDPDPFCLVQITNVRPLANDVILIDDETDEESLRNQCEITIDISTIGGSDALPVAVQLHASTKSSGFDAIFAGVLGRGSVGDIKNLTGIDAADLRPRYEFRVVGFIALSLNFAAEFFDNVGIVINEHDRGEVYSITVPEPEA